MDAAQDIEGAGHVEGDLNIVAGFLVAGVEIETARLDIGVMRQVSIIVDDADDIATLDVKPARPELPPTLGHLVGGPGNT